MPTFVEQTFDDWRYECGKEYCLAVLALTKGNVAQGAKISGRNRSDFYRLLRRFDVHGAGKPGPHRPILSLPGRAKNNRGSDEQKPSLS